MRHHLAAGLLAGLALAALAPAAGAQQPAKPPNIIVILADDLGYGDLGCYGHKRFKTPNLDTLAKRGVRLTACYAPVPFCAPSRGSLLTGRFPPRHGLTGNPLPKADPLYKIAKGADDFGLPLEEVTLADLLRAAGYVTGMVGKWHLGHQARFYPTRRGFGEYFGILYSNDMRRVELIDGEKVVEYPVVQATLTKRYAERAVEFITRNKGRPFFLYLALAMPHKPLACSEAFYKKSGAGLYGDVMAEMDWGVGQIAAKLRELGLEENTLIIFTSDNGPWYGGSTGGLRGMKGTHWEGGLRVPFIASWPARIPAGRTSDGLATLADVLPTALAAARVAPPKKRKLDGKDLLPMLEGKAKSPHEAVFSFRGDTVSSVRAGKWKLHLLPPQPPKFKAWAPEDKYTDPRAPDGVTLLAPFEQIHPSQFPGVLTGDTVTKTGLFDLDADPSEQRNVIEMHADVVARLQRLAQALQDDLPPPKKGKK